MNRHHICRFCRVTALATLVAGFGFGQVITAPPDPADSQEGVEVLTRGPVHEAFAETVTFDPEPGIVVPKSPPAAIEELPPDQKPEGDERRVDPRLLGLGRRAERFFVGQRHLAGSATWSPMGARVLGPSRQKVFSGLPGTGPMPKRAKLNTCPSRLQPSRLVRTLPRLRQTRVGCPAVGFGSRAATLGALVTGRPCSRIGTGSLPITSGPRAAMCSSMATGIIRSPVAVCCLRRFSSMRVSTRGKVSPTRQRW